MSVDPSVSCWFPHYRCPCSVRKIPLCPAGQHGLGHASLASPKHLQACLEGRKIHTFSTSANVRNGWGLTCVISKLWSQLSKQVVKFAAILAQALLFEHKSEEVGLSENQAPWPRHSSHGEVHLLPWWSLLERWPCRSPTETGSPSGQEHASGPDEVAASTSEHKEPWGGLLGLPIREASFCSVPLYSVTLLLLQPHYMEIER